MTTDAARAEHLAHLRAVAAEFVAVAQRSAASVAQAYPATYGTPEQRSAHVLDQVVRYLLEHADGPDDELAALTRGVLDGLTRGGGR